MMTLQAQTLSRMVLQALQTTGVQSVEVPLAGYHVVSERHDAEDMLPTYPMARILGNCMRNMDELSAYIQASLTSGVAIVVHTDAYSEDLDPIEDMIAVVLAPGQDIAQDSTRFYEAMALVVA